MPATPVEFTPEKTVKRSSLWDLLWYILCGFGLFTAAGTLLGLWMQGKTGSLLFSVLVYVSNILFLGGTALVLGAGRGKFTLAEIGLVPPRWRWTWLAVAVGLGLFLLPRGGGVGGLGGEFVKRKPGQPGGALAVDPSGRHRRVVFWFDAAFCGDPGTHF